MAELHAVRAVLQGSEPNSLAIATLLSVSEHVGRAVYDLLNANARNLEVLVTLCLVARMKGVDVATVNMREALTGWSVYRVVRRCPPDEIRPAPHFTAAEVQTVVDGFRGSAGSSAGLSSFLGAKHPNAALSLPAEIRDGVLTACLLLRLDGKQIRLLDLMVIYEAVVLDELKHAEG